MGILCDGLLISNNIDEFGVTVTVRTVTKTFSDWGDATETLVDTTGVKTVMNITTQNDNFVREGIFKNGDIIFYFKGTQSNISNGNRIQYGSEWFEIDDVIPTIVGTTTYLQVAKVRRV